MPVAHAFTIDVEGFSEGMAESFPVPERLVRGRAEKEEIAANVADALAFLDAHQVKGSFFVLGIIAEEQPEVVRAIARAGHEIGSHSYMHRRLYNLDPAAVKEAVYRSKAVLEDVAGRPVVGFRAPDFSVNQATPHILDLVQEAGYTYDASIFPIAGHDVYGISDAVPYIHRLENGLVEFPACTLELFRRRWPALGGGYFRLYPFWLSRQILQAYDRRGRPAMLYTHPYELGPHHPQIEGLSLARRVRHYANMGKSKERLSHLFEQFTFRPAVEVLRGLGHAV